MCGINDGHIPLAFGAKYSNSAVLLSIHIWAGLFVYASTGEQVADSRTFT
jgi:O-antigen/teichoic acid export membrane protein